MKYIFCYNKCYSEKKTGGNGQCITFRIKLSEKPHWKGVIAAKLKGNQGANYFITEGEEFFTEETKSTKAQSWK